MSRNAAWTMDAAVDAVAFAEDAEGAALDDGLWGRSRDFDWGD